MVPSNSCMPNGRLTFQAVFLSYPILGERDFNGRWRSTLNRKEIGGIRGCLTHQMTGKDAILVDTKQRSECVLVEGMLWPA